MLPALHLSAQEMAQVKGDKIFAQPVMEATISKTKLNESKSRDGVKCLFYEARTNASHKFQAEIYL